MNKSISIFVLGLFSSASFAQAPAPTPVAPKPPAAAPASKPAAPASPLGKQRQTTPPKPPVNTGRSGAM
jgi:hypothetical protein